jgi:hypothetical protein
MDKARVGIGGRRQIICQQLSIHLSQFIGPSLLLNNGYGQ